MKENEFLKNLPNLRNRLSNRICTLGEGGEGIVTLHEETQQKKKVAVKSVHVNERNAKK